MRRLLVTVILVVPCLVLFAAGVRGAEICVDTGAELQAALSTAAANGEDDVIRVVQGTYTGSFTYYTSENHGIALRGGYTAGCATRVIDPANTILDGNNSGTVLRMEHYPTSGPSGMIVEGFTLRHGLSTGGGGGARVYCYASSGPGTNISFLTNVVSENTSQAGGGIHVYVYSAAGAAGAITFTGNTIAANEAYDYAGGLYAYAGSDSDAESGNMVFADNTISGNVSYGSCGGASVGTGAETGAAGNITFTHNTISGNHAYQDTGGIYASTGANSATTGGGYHFRG